MVTWPRDWPDLVAELPGALLAGRNPDRATTEPVKARGRAQDALFAIADRLARPRVPLFPPPLLSLLPLYHVSLLFTP